jgi:DmsE family decaheme c-type cytochrome
MRQGLSVLGVVVLLLGGAVALAGGLPAREQAVPPKPAGQWDVADCKTCHEKAVGPAFERSKHGRLEQSCSSCHTNVAEHAKSQMAGEKGPVPSLKNQKAQQINETCLTCHEKANQASFMSSMHARRNVSCTTCHGIHDFKSAKAQLKTAADIDTCFSCHKSERAKSMRTSHHPLREGKMGCVSCHNPHDGTNPKMLSADSINEKCYQCHTEKRGPFLYEHAPVREECVNCHDPHGSNHERLLVAKQPYLCQRCHFSGHGLTADNLSSLEGLPVAPPGSTVTRSSRNTERGCKQCHLAIHGSNSPSGAFFVR